MIPAAAAPEYHPVQLDQTQLAEDACTTIQTYIEELERSERDYQRYHIGVVDEGTIKPFTVSSLLTLFCTSMTALISSIFVSGDLETRVLPKTITHHVLAYINSHHNESWAASLIAEANTFEHPRQAITSSLNLICQTHGIFVKTFDLEFTIPSSISSGVPLVMAASMLGGALLGVVGTPLIENCMGWPRAPLTVCQLKGIPQLMDRIQNALNRDDEEAPALQQLTQLRRDRYTQALANADRVFNAQLKIYATQFLYLTLWASFIGAVCGLIFAGLRCGSYLSDFQNTSSIGQITKIPLECLRHTPINMTATLAGESYPIPGGFEYLQNQSAHLYSDTLINNTNHLLTIPGAVFAAFPPTVYWIARLCKAIRQRRENAPVEVIDTPADAVETQTDLPREDIEQGENGGPEQETADPSSASSSHYDASCSADELD